MCYNVILNSNSGGSVPSCKKRRRFRAAWKGVVTVNELAAAGGMYRANPDYILREVAGEQILIPTGETAMRFNGLASLNETGLFLWKRLAEACTAETLAAALAQEYELTEEQSQQDVADFLKSSMERALVLRQ